MSYLWCVLRLDVCLSFATCCNLQLPANWVIYFWVRDELPIFVCTCAMQTSVLGVRGNVTETVSCNYLNKWWTFCTSWLYVYRTMELFRCPKAMIAWLLVCLCTLLDLYIVVKCFPSTSASELTSWIKAWITIWVGIEHRWNLHY